MYFENNRKIHADLNTQLGEMRRRNIELNEKIQTTKKQILDLV